MISYHNFLYQNLPNEINSKLKVNLSMYVLGSLQMQIITEYAQCAAFNVHFFLWRNWSNVSMPYQYVLNWWLGDLVGSEGTKKNTPGPKMNSVREELLVVVGFTYMYVSRNLVVIYSIGKQTNSNNIQSYCSNSNIIALTIHVILLKRFYWLFQ